MKTTIDHDIRQKMMLSNDEYVMLSALLNIDFKNNDWPDLKLFGINNILELKDELICKNLLVSDGRIFIPSEKALSFFKPDHSILVAEIVSFLNKESKSKFDPARKSTATAINARIKEGFTYENFVNVIQFMCKEWTGTKQEQYIRPQTLFGDKFEGYLHAAQKNVKKEPENKSMDGMVM